MITSASLKYYGASEHHKVKKPTTEFKNRKAFNNALVKTFILTIIVYHYIKFQFIYNRMRY